MGYFLLPPSHIEGSGTNHHVFTGTNDEKTGNYTMATKSECGLVNRNDQARYSDPYYATEADLVRFFRNCGDTRICASCSDMHKHADPK